MESYAIAEVAGRQFRIEEGTKVTVPRLEGDTGSDLKLDRILLVNKDGKVTVGTPYVDGASAAAKIVDHGRGRKVWVFKKKRRKGFKKSAGSRQHLTTLEIGALSA